MKKDSICKFIVSACISIKRVGEETNPRVRAFFSKFGWSELSYRSQCYYKTLKQTGL